MKISRASFLRHASLAFLAIFVDPSALLRRSFRPPVMSAASFRGCVNQPFALRTSAGKLADLTLTEIAETPTANGVEQFLLLFRGSTASIPDGIYQLEHPALGRFELFINAVGMPGRHCYQACFTRFS